MWAWVDVHTGRILILDPIASTSFQFLLYFLYSRCLSGGLNARNETYLPVPGSSVPRSIGLRDKLLATFYLSRY